MTRKEGKVFFFEKKKQKAFVPLSGAYPRAADREQSFLVLFCKKGRLAFFAVGLCAASGDATQIGIDNFSFGRGLITIGAGTTVVWTNQDDIPHTVIGLSGAGFRSHPLDSGDSFSFVFAKQGTFQYFCSLHPKMRGTVVVR